MFGNSKDHDNKKLITITLATFYNDGRENEDHYVLFPNIAVYIIGLHSTSQLLLWLQKY